MNVLFSIVLLFVPLRMETGHFTIYQDGKKMGTEDFSITPRQGGYVVEGHTVLSTPDQKANLKSHMELDEALKVTDYQFTSDAGSLHLKIGSPLSTFEYTAQGDKQSDDIRFPEDGMILDSNFFHHYAILLYRVAAKPGNSAVPAFVPQALLLGSVSLRSVGNNTYDIDSGNLKVTATTDKDGKLIKLTVPDAKVVVER